MENDVSENQQRLSDIFFPRASEQLAGIKRKGSCFVHYTSAEAAVKIIKNKEMWMRKSSTMNDFMEIEHGIKCLNYAYRGSSGESFRSILEAIHQGLSSEIESSFNARLPEFQNGTFLACFSEHAAEKENKFGRLSMWRAYGGTTGVAIVMKGASFIGDSDALKIYMSPVSYLNADDFRHEFESLVTSIKDEIEFLKSQSKDVLLGNIFQMFRFAILCTKHPGFEEEKEWRAIYNPSFASTDRVTEAVEIIHGTPQPVVRVPLKDYPDEGLIGITLPDLIDRIIIGPTQYPRAIFDAFCHLLADAGVEDAESKIFISDIPLRTGT